MSASAKQLPETMTSEEFLLWAEKQPGRYEFIDGFPLLMQAEQNRHSLVKGRAFRALDNAITLAGVPYQAWPDGVAVRISDSRTREPDAAVTCGVAQNDEALALEGVIIAVEVLSPSNSNTDKVEKLAEYGSVPGLRHYLIVHPAGRYVIHYRFGTDATETKIVREGDLVLDPPGLVIPLADLFPVDVG
jgi:Uma2 family endonuclease